MKEINYAFPIFQLDDQDDLLNQKHYAPILLSNTPREYALQKDMRKLDIDVIVNRCNTISS